MPNVRIFVGHVRPLPTSGRPSAIFKQSVNTPIRLTKLGFVGDEQADRRVHGGPDKAVHLYPATHYTRLALRFPDVAAQLLPGSIGENLSTADLDESQVRIGEIWQLGESQLQVCQPRNPCWKIDERFASDGMAKYIAEQRLTGWYWRVTRSGTVRPGDALELVQAASAAPTLAEAMRLWDTHRPELAELERLSSTPGIASDWQTKIRQRLAYLRRL